MIWLEITNKNASGNTIAGKQDQCFFYQVKIGLKKIREENFISRKKKSKHSNKVFQHFYSARKHLFSTVEI